MLWLVAAIIFVYFFYTRIWIVYSTIYYYKKQGIKFHSGIIPVLGSYVQIMKHQNP